jgi:iduronate 2-sulfatase
LLYLELLQRDMLQGKLVRPNILLIIVDDLKPVLGCYGDKLARTPNIDQLARSAYSFGNNHCQQALSSPSRSSFLTGKRPDYLMVWEVTTKLRYMIPNIVTMPQYFKHNGYETAAIGKVFDPRSVDADHDSVSWSIPYENTRSSAPQGDKWVFAQYPVSTESADIHDSLTLDGQILLKGLRQLNQFSETGKPFFLAIGFNKPNLPFVAPQKYWDLYNRDHIRVPAFQEYA